MATGGREHARSISKREWACSHRQQESRSSRFQSANAPSVLIGSGAIIMELNICSGCGGAPLPVNWFLTLFLAALFPNVFYVWFNEAHKKYKIKDTSNY